MLTIQYMKFFSQGGFAMTKKIPKIAKDIIGTVLILWGAMFVTDYVFCSSLKEPIFVIQIDASADDGGSAKYLGLGYTVEVEKYVDAEYGTILSSVEMKVFGQVIAASIT